MTNSYDTGVATFVARRGGSTAVYRQKTELPRLVRVRLRKSRHATHQKVGMIGSDFFVNCVTGAFHL